MKVLLKHKEKEQKTTVNHIKFMIKIHRVYIEKKLIKKFK